MLQIQHGTARKPSAPPTTPRIIGAPRDHTGGLSAEAGEQTGGTWVAIGNAVVLTAHFPQALPRCVEADDPPPIRARIKWVCRQGGGAPLLPGNLLEDVVKGAKERLWGHQQCLEAIHCLVIQKLH